MARTLQSIIKELTPPGYMSLGDVARSVGMTHSKVHNRMITRRLDYQRRARWWFLLEEHIPKVRDNYDN